MATASLPVSLFMLLSLFDIAAGAETLHDFAKLKELREYCEAEYFQPRCGNNEVIVMTTANYGRMHIGRCAKKNMGHIGCYKDVQSILDRRCSGRMSCEVRMPDTELDKTQPCDSELKTYLQAQYKCVPVMTPSFTCTNTKQWIITEPLGYLANSVALDTNCGSLTSPLTIQAKPGQRINVTLFNFDPVSSARDFTEGGRDCDAFANIIDTYQGDKTVEVCRGGSREKQTYISSNRSIDLVLYQTRSDGYQHGPFLIYFEAVGCADIEPPEGMWVRRNDNEARVGCHMTREVWTFVCADGKWIGDVKNCSKSIILRPGDHKRVPVGLSHGVSVIIIVTIAIGIGVVVLLCGIFIIKRMRKNTSRNVNVDTVRSTDEAEELEQLKVNYDNEMRKCHQNDPEILQHVIYDKSKKDNTGYSPLHTCMHEAAHVQLRGPEVLWKANTMTRNHGDYEVGGAKIANNACAGQQGTMKDNVAMVPPCAMSTFVTTQNKHEHDAPSGACTLPASTLPSTHTSTDSTNATNTLNPSKQSLRSFHDSVYSDRPACIHTQQRQGRNPRNIYEPKRTRVLYTLNNSF